MAESSESDIAQRLDTPYAPGVDALPPDVVDIVASLEAEHAEVAEDAGALAEMAPPTEEPEGELEYEMEPPETVYDGIQVEPAEMMASVIGDDSSEIAPSAAVEQGDSAYDPTEPAPVNDEEDGVPVAVGPVPAVGSGAHAAEAAPEVAPEPAAVPVAAAERTAPRTARVPWWPFLAYLMAWAVVCGIAAWLALQTPPGETVYGTDLYQAMVTAGLILTAAGPCLIIAVWLASLLRSRGASRAGLLTSSLIKGALTTFGGVALWLAVLMMADTLRFGRSL